MKSLKSARAPKIKTDEILELKKTIDTMASQLRSLAQERKRSEEALVFLNKADVVLSASLDYEDTFKQMAQLVAENLSDWCAIERQTDEGPKLVATAHVDPSRVALIERAIADLPREVERGAKAQVARVGAFGMQSVMSVPLVARGKINGTIVFASSVSARIHDNADLRIAEELGRRAGAAMDNARLYREAKQAIAARDEFFSIASHELRTPITPLKLQLQLVRRMNNADVSREQLKRSLEQLAETSDRQLDRLTALVNELLDVSRIRGGQLHLSTTQVDLVEIVREVLQRFDRQLQKIGCEVEIIAEHAVVGCWDYLRIEQVFTNLLTNAMKYGQGKPIKVEVSSTGNRAHLTVRDQGIGIPKEDQSRIFSRFERAVSATNFGGLGLGLYIVSQILEAHSGKVSVESIPGSGSSFHVELPLKPPDEVNLSLVR